MADAKSFDVVVIGGGSGLTAAYYAQREGRSVAVVEERAEALGGTCTNFGCLPTKGLIESARALSALRRAGALGVHVDGARVDFPAVMDGVRRARAHRAGSVRRWVEGALSPYYGRARFVGDKLLEMEDGRRLTGERIFVAAGARPAAPPVPGLADVEYWTNESILDIESQPRRLIILGGGYIGCEFAHFFRALGTEVTLVDRADCLLREDDDVRAIVTRELSRGLDLRMGATASRAWADGDGVALAIAPVAGRETAEDTVWADGILIATGRRPNTDRLALAATGVELDEAGWIRVDDELRTTHPDIFAYGDVIGRAMFKHTSSYEGELAYRNSEGAGRTVSYRANPHAIFTDPEVGSVGLTEAACREQGLIYKVGRADYDSFSRGQIIGSPPGFAKLLVEEGTDRILGFHLVGPHAADLVHEVVVAMNAGSGTAGLVRDTIHIHPTLPELVHKVFSQV